MTNKQVALITTTIHDPIVLRSYVDRTPDDVDLRIVVAGDVKTPKSAERLVQEIGGTYLGVEGHNVERWHSHNAIGFNSIQRRNLALLHALATGAEYVITIDDDNEPLSATYVSDMIRGFDFHEHIDVVINTDTKWWNPGESAFVQRGFPLEQRHIPYIEGENESEDIPKIGVVQGLTIGDPDIDAIERIVRQPRVNEYDVNEDVILNIGTWAPFNSQNTCYVRELAPLMQMMSGVGRYDDIWASYVARAVMDHFGWHVRYGQPLTYSDRNEHNLVTDLERELYGYRYTTEFTDALRAIDLSESTSIAQAMGFIFDDSRIRQLLPFRAVEASYAWLHDVQVAMDEGK